MRKQRKVVAVSGHFLRDENKDKKQIPLFTERWQHLQKKWFKYAIYLFYRFVKLIMIPVCWDATCKLHTAKLPNPDFNCRRCCREITTAPRPWVAWFIFYNCRLFSKRWQTSQHDTNLKLTSKAQHIVQRDCSYFIIVSGVLGITPNKPISLVSLRTRWPDLFTHESWTQKHIYFVHSWK